MNILVDESVGQQILHGSVTTYSNVAEMPPVIDDDEVLRAANEHGALLLTAESFSYPVYASVPQDPCPSL